MLTPTQKAIIAAIEAGHTTTRAIAAHAGLASNSNVARQLQQLAADGHLVLEPGPQGLVVADGREFVAGWNAAARAAGNEEA